jgi:hypothetical protein
MRPIRIALALVATLALAATLALLAVAAPAASKQHAGAAVYCPDKDSRQADVKDANAAVKRATANVKAKTKTKTNAKAKAAHRKVAAAQKALKVAKARLADAKDAQTGAKASLGECD